MKLKDICVDTVIVKKASGTDRFVVIGIAGLPELESVRAALENNHYAAESHDEDTTEPSVTDKSQRKLTDCLEGLSHKDLLSEAGRSKLSSIADELLRANDARSSCKRSGRNWKRGDVRERCRGLVGEADRMCEFAQYLANMQADYLNTGLWMRLKRLTYLEVAEQYPQWSETVIRRTIQDMWIRLRDRKIHASVLVCSNDLPVLCGHVDALLQEQPQLGAPALTRQLRARGIEVSQRHVGNALKFLKKVHEHRPQDAA